MTKPEIETYKVALKTARQSFDTATKRLRDIENEQWELGREIAGLRRTITALAAMCSESPWFDELGITDACLEVMEAQRGMVTTTEVVDLLERIGFDVKSQKNINASAHAVLTRLARKGKIEKVDNPETGVSWKGPKFDPEYDPNDVPF